MKYIQRAFEIIGFLIKAVFKIPSWILTWVARILGIKELVGKASGWKTAISAAALIIAGFLGSIEPFLDTICNVGFNWACPGNELYIIIGYAFGALRLANVDVKIPDWLK